MVVLKLHHLLVGQIQFHFLKMAHYAYISNAEFTITERARLLEVEQEINSICQNNKETEGYKILNETLETKYTSDTLESLQAELLNIETYSDDWFHHDSFH